MVVNPISFRTCRNKLNNSCSSVVNWILGPYPDCGGRGRRKCCGTGVGNDNVELNRWMDATFFTTLDRSKFELVSILFRFDCIGFVDSTTTRGDCWFVVVACSLSMVLVEVVVPLRNDGPAFERTNFRASTTEAVAEATLEVLIADATADMAVTTTGVIVSIILYCVSNRDVGNICDK